MRLYVSPGRERDAGGPTPTSDMRFDCHEACAEHPWVREVWLMGPARPRGEPADPADAVIVSDAPPRSVPHGRRERLLGQLETCTDRRLALRVVTPRQLSRWLSQESRFAAAFRSAVRLYP